MGRDRKRAREPSMRQRCTAAGIVPRAVIANEAGAVGVVLEVNDDGTFAVAFTRGRLRTCSLGERLEILAGPREWHAGRVVVLEEWHERPADWPGGSDAASDAFELEAWAKLGELATARGFTIGEDLEVRLVVRRPRVRVPSVLELTREEALALHARTGDLDRYGRPWRVPFTFAAEPPSHPPVVEDGRRGRVAIKLETDDGGPAWLSRDGKAEPLFEGRWVDIQEAHAYAREHGHDFAIE